MLVLNLCDYSLSLSSILPSSLLLPPGLSFYFPVLMSLSMSAHLNASPTWSYSTVSTLPPLLAARPSLDRFVTVGDWLYTDGYLLPICVRPSGLTGFDSLVNPDSNLSMRRRGRTFNSLSICALTFSPVELTESMP